MRWSFWGLACGLLWSGNAFSEPLILQGNNNLSLSIYNQNLSLVKDVRTADLQNGLNEVIFEGVAQRIQPETAIIYGDAMQVKEQNYSYNLMSYSNFIQRNIGQKVGTVRVNPTTGENIYEKAELIGEANGQPILRFAYGIDSNFGGRVIFSDIPAGLSNKPMLTAQLEVSQAGNKNLYLAYLTEGLSWRTDYVANIRSSKQLDLTGWVTISNNSGIDYEKAKIQLVAGDVNAVRQEFQPRMAKMMLATAAVNDMATGITPETVSSYEIYTLPNITTIKNMQDKQVALIEKNNVEYTKEFNFNSPLYFGNYNNNEFKNRHPQITYVLENNAEHNLGISLPRGTVRFYENDKNGNMQFIGADNIANTAKEDTLRLDLGEAFNISVSGKISKAAEKELSRLPHKQCVNVKILRTFDVEITVNNAENNANIVYVKQNFPQTDYKIVKENIDGENKDVTTRVWPVAVKAADKTLLTFSVEIPDMQHLCD